MSVESLVRELLEAQVSKADCRRRHVGAVLVQNGWIVGWGSNALPKGSCEAGQCPRGLLSYEQAPKDVGYENPAHPCHAIHAEHAALRMAFGRSQGAIAYISEWPCPGCEKRLKDAGVIGFIRVEIPPPPALPQVEPRPARWVEPYETRGNWS